MAQEVIFSGEQFAVLVVGVEQCRLSEKQCLDLSWLPSMSFDILQWQTFCREFERQAIGMKSESPGKHDIESLVVASPALCQASPYVTDFIVKSLYGKHFKPIMKKQLWYVLYSVTAWYMLAVVTPIPVALYDRFGKSQLALGYESAVGPSYIGIAVRHDVQYNIIVCLIVMMSVQIPV
jgi:hypothetical protein